jgi:drug/metabolite transporter, DME family
VSASPNARTTAPINSRYAYGCGLVVFAGLVLSLGVFCIRGATASDAWQYLFWRALGFTSALITIASLRDHRNPLQQVMHLEVFAWVSAISLSMSQITFISAIKITTFAETFFLCSLAPLITAMLARPMLGERIGRIVLVAIALALAGVLAMTGGRLDGGNWAGRTLSIASAFTFACYAIATRGSKPHDLDAGLLAVGLLTTTASLAAVILLDLPMVPSRFDVVIAYFHGALILSAGLFFFGQGSRYIPGVTFALLAQSEAVFAPLWGYLFFEEQPTFGTVTGGVMILAAVVMQAAAGERGSHLKVSAR